MKKKICLLVMFLGALNIAYAQDIINNSASENQIQEQKETGSVKEEPNKSETGAAAPVKEFEYKSCDNDSGVAACKIEDLEKENKPIK